MVNVFVVMEKATAEPAGAFPDVREAELFIKDMTGWTEFQDEFTIKETRWCP